MIISMSKVGFNIAFLFFSLLSQFVQGQEAYTKNDSVKIYGLLEKANFFLNENGGIVSAKNYCEEALNRSRAVNFKRAEAEALLLLFSIQFKKSELENLDAYNSSALQLGLELNDFTIIASAYNNKGIHSSFSGKQMEAIQFFEKALAAGYETKQNSATAEVYNNIGGSYMELAEYDNQMQWQTKSLILFEKLGDKKGIAQAMDNIAGLNLEMGDNSQSISNAKNSVAIREEIGNYEDLATGYNNLAQIYLFSGNDVLSKEFGNKGLKYAELSGFNANLAHAYTTQTLLLNRQGNNKDALLFEKKAINILEKNGNNIMLSRRYISAAILSNAKEINDSLASAYYYQKALDLASLINARMNMRDIYLFRSRFYLSHKNFEKAYSDYTAYILRRDSLVNEETKSKIADIETKYETEKKDNEIVKLNASQQIKQLEIEKQKALIAGNAAMALQKQNEIDILSQAQELRDIKIKQQNEELEKQLLLAKTSSQQLQIAEKDNQLKLKQLKNQKLTRNLLIGGLALFLLLGFTYFNRYQLKKKLEQQEQVLLMRNNISQNLHDDIGASLSSINILNELARRNLAQPEKSNEYLTKASEDIQRISESLSDIVWNINPRYDDLQNLFIRMKRYAADMLDGKNIIGQYHFPGEDSKLGLSMTQRRDLYLVFKEAINNLAKYSQAKNAVINIKSDDQSIQLLVEDDGIGFDMSTLRKGNGLHNMEQRAMAAGAILTVSSKPGMGTAIRMELKVN